MQPKTLELHNSNAANWHLQVNVQVAVSDLLAVYALTRMQSIGSELGYGLLKLQQLLNTQLLLNYPVEGDLPLTVTCSRIALPNCFYDPNSYVRHRLKYLDKLEIYQESFLFRSVVI